MSRVITGQQLKSQRVLRGMSQGQVAELLRVNQKTIANWEASHVPGAREAEVREGVFFTDTQSLLDAVSTWELQAELMRRMARLEALVAARTQEDQFRQPPRPEDQWFGAAPPRRTRKKEDPPEAKG